MAKEFDEQRKQMEELEGYLNELHKKVCDFSKYLEMFTGDDLRNAAIVMRIGQNSLGLKGTDGSFSDKDIAATMEVLSDTIANLNIFQLFMSGLLCIKGKSKEGFSLQMTESAHEKGTVLSAIKK